MPCFSIRPIDSSHLPIELDAFDGGAVLYMLSRHQWTEADVYQRDEYLFSLRMAQGGFWTIFQRDEGRKNEIDAFG